MGRQTRTESVAMVFGGTLFLQSSGIWTYDRRNGGERVVTSTRQRDVLKATEVAKRMAARTHMTETAFGKAYESDYFDAYKNTRKNAQKRGIAFSLSLDDYKALVERSNGACELTGISFQRVRNIGPYERQPFMPSIDRKDSSGGYDVANVRLLCTAANLAINTWGDWVLMELTSAMRKRPSHAIEKASQINEM